jgi:predicted transcriptional regulator
MNALHRIRTEVFGVRQSEMAVIAGVTQSTVSRWEAGEFQPSLPQMNNIRECALKRGIAWDDSLFFEAGPKQAAE